MRVVKLMFVKGCVEIIAKNLNSSIDVRFPIYDLRNIKQLNKELERDEGFCPPPVLF